MTKILDKKLLSDQAQSTDLFLELETKQYSFRSSYFMIQGTKLILRIICLPFFIWSLFCLGSKLRKVEAANSNLATPEVPEQPKEKVNFFRRMVVKLCMSLFLLTQLDGYTYLVSSVRVKSRFLDIISMVLNMAFSLPILVWFGFISLRKSRKFDYQYDLISSQFLHFKNHQFKNLFSHSRCSMPVVIIHTIFFATKAFILVISSSVAGLNVYVFCFASSIISF